MDYSTLVGLADAGADFQEFVSGNIGSYLVKRAEQEEVAALRKLMTVDPSDEKAVKTLQLEAAVPRRLIVWIADVIEAGKTAKWQLEQGV
jgi:hypothetical protein